MAKKPPVLGVIKLAGRLVRVRLKKITSTGLRVVVLLEDASPAYRMGETIHCNYGEFIRDNT